MVHLGPFPPQLGVQFRPFDRKGRLDLFNLPLGLAVDAPAELDEAFAPLPLALVPLDQFGLVRVGLEHRPYQRVFQSLARRREGVLLNHPRAQRGERARVVEGLEHAGARPNPLDAQLVEPRPQPGLGYTTQPGEGRGPVELLRRGVHFEHAGAVRVGLVRRRAPRRGGRLGKPAGRRLPPGAALPGAAGRTHCCAALAAAGCALGLPLAALRRTVRPSPRLQYSCVFVQLRVSTDGPLALNSTRAGSNGMARPISRGRIWLAAAPVRMQALPARRAREVQEKSAQRTSASSARGRARAAHQCKHESARRTWI